MNHDYRVVPLFVSLSQTPIFITPPNKRFFWVWRVDAPALCFFKITVFLDMASCRTIGIYHHLKSICYPKLSGYKLVVVDCVWNVMAHVQKTVFVFRRKGRVHLNRRGRQFSRLLAAEVYVSAVVMLDTTCSVVVWRVLATHSIRKFPLHFPSRASPCAIPFQLDSTFLQPP